MIRIARLNIIVKGQTEENFVEDRLREFLASHEVYVKVRCVETGREPGRIYKGGMTSYAKAKRDIRDWLLQETLAE